MTDLVNDHVRWIVVEDGGTDVLGMYTSEDAAVSAPPPSSSAPLAADLYRIGETADRFDRPRLVEIAVARFAMSDEATRARDAAITRALAAVATPLIGFGLGFLSSFAL